MSIFDLLRTSQQSRREAALKTYREILARFDMPKSGDGDRLAQALAELGWPADTVNTDVEVIRELRRLEALHGKLAQYNAAEERARQEHYEYCQETQRVWQERREKQAALGIAASSALDMATTARAAGGQIRELQKHAPHLFATES